MQRWRGRANRRDGCDFDDDEPRRGVDEHHDRAHLDQHVDHDTDTFDVDSYDNDVHDDDDEHDEHHEHEHIDEHVDHDHTATGPPRVPSGTGTDLVPFQALDLSADVVEVGQSVLGAPILAERLGTPGGRRVLVIGVIHGDEDAGTAIVDELRRLGAPDGVELWLVESMNPDGQAAQTRHNADQVDLNRNFPYKWGPIGSSGDGQYAGPGPASEPETQAMVNFIAQLRPDIVIWYHQDLYVISPGQGRDGRIRARYAELTGWPMGGISGGTYTGIAATWARHELAADDSAAFIVELGASLTPDEATMHAEAVRTVAAEG